MTGRGKQESHSLTVSKWKGVQLVIVGFKERIEVYNVAQWESQACAKL
jgi:hypothetical protein